MSADTPDSIDGLGKPESAFSLRRVLTIEGLFLPVAEWLIAREFDIVKDLDRKLTQARMGTTLESYLSRTVGYAFAVGVTLWFFGTVSAYGLVASGAIGDGALVGLSITNPTLLAVIETLRVPFLVGLLGLTSGLLSAGAVAAAAYAIPAQRAAERKREIEALLPESVAFMYALSVGGLNQLEIFRAVAAADDTYGEVATEFQAIMQNTTYAGEDYRSALRQCAIETPSSDLSQFFTDMLSIISSGGSLEEFLEAQKNAFITEAQKKEEDRIEIIELSGQIYITLSVAPVMLLIVFLVMDLLGSNPTLIMYMTVYIIVPLMSMAHLALVSTVQPDEFGSGLLTYNGERIDGAGKSYDFSLGNISEYDADHALFDHLRKRSISEVVTDFLTRPHRFFRDDPRYTLVFSVPVTLGLLGAAFVFGDPATSWDGLTANPVGTTFTYLYIPLYVIGIPLALAYWSHARYYQGITNGLAEHLRKISSANDTGQTLLESFGIVAENSDDRFADELDRVQRKVQYGVSLKRALIEFNNKYGLPKLARIVRVITEANETSGKISRVLATTAQVTENQQAIRRERKRATNSQVFIIIATYVIMLGVMLSVQYQFVGLVDGLTEQAASGANLADTGGLDFTDVTSPAVLTTLFFHSMVLQAIFAGVAAGYMRSGKVLSGVKFIIPLATLPLIGWAMIV